MIILFYHKKFFLKNIIANFNILKFNYYRLKMKFLSLFATLSAVAKVALASYCGSQCDPNKVPETPLSGPLKLVAVVDNQDKSIRYEVAGTVVIENDCVFSVKGFKLTPKSDGAKWYGASEPNSSEGILLSKEEVGVTSSPSDLSYNIKDTDLFCHASLLTDVGNGGVIRLMDKNYQLLAFAKIAPGAVASTTTAAASTPGIKNPSTTTTKKSTTKTKKSSTTTKKSSTTTKKSTTVAEEKSKTTAKTEEKPASQAASATPSVVDATKAGNDTEAATGAAAASVSQTPTPSGNVVSVITGTASQKQDNNNNNNSNTSGAFSSYKIPSLALYVALFVIAFIRF